MTEKLIKVYYCRLCGKLRKIDLIKGERCPNCNQRAYFKVVGQKDNYNIHCSVCGRGLSAINPCGCVPLNRQKTRKTHTRTEKTLKCKNCSTKIRHNNKSYLCRTCYLKNYHGEKVKNG